MTDKILTQARLKELLHYNSDTGVFTRKTTIQYNAEKGMVVGSICPGGYLQVSLQGVVYTLHRLAFLYCGGAFPEQQVDHKNHDRADNRWCNLRESTNKQNSRNMSLSVLNTSGYTGVHWTASLGKWIAYIKVDGIRRHLGCYVDIIDAVDARQAANRKYGFHANHGK